MLVNMLFIIQLISSFLVGGGMVALLSFIAERVHKNISGIILAFPTTLALGFFFLGWVTSSEEVASIVPTILFPLGLSVLFVMTYSYLAFFLRVKIQDKIFQIVCTLFFNTIVWFTLTVLIINLEITSLLFGSIFYLFLVIVSHKLLHLKNFYKPVSIKYTSKQRLIRMISAGFVLLIVVLFAKILGPVWGGVLALFPIAFSIMMVIIHYQYGVTALFPSMQKAPLGSFSLFFYAITAMLVFPSVGFIIGTIISYLVSIIVTIILVYIQKIINKTRYVGDQ